MLTLNMYSMDLDTHIYVYINLEIEQPYGSGHKRPHSTAATDHHRVDETDFTELIHHPLLCHSLQDVQFLSNYRLCLSDQAHNTNEQGT